jgi:hypothetical protein
MDAKYGKELKRRNEKNQSIRNVVLQEDGKDKLD